MKKLFLLMALAICALGVNAQNTKVITGAVIDKNGNPLPNALVEATGGAESVATDADGSYRIEVPIWLKSLTAKYAGFRDKKIKIKSNSQLIFEMKHKHVWFLDAAYSINFGDCTFSRAGFMCGYLGKWGGYTRVMTTLGCGEYAIFLPSVTVGVIKQVTDPAYLYFGAGFASVFRYNYYGINDEPGGMVETGAIFKFNHVNFSVGYACSSSFDSFSNHSVQLSVGYCF